MEMVDFAKILDLYRHELLVNAIPFWTKHTIDHKYGGILSAITDDAQIVSTDKYMWSQLRAIYTFSALYNKIEKRDEWLDLAWNIFNFCNKYGRDEQGQWLFSVTQDGHPIQSQSIYSDAFAIYGFTELARASGAKEPLELALETARGVERRLAKPGSYETEPFPNPPASKGHGVAMLFTSVFDELGNYLNESRWLEVADYLAYEVMQNFRRPEFQLIYEYLNFDNTLIDSPQGRVIIDGHAIESMWFMLHHYRRTNNQTRISEAIEALHWHVEKGWDWEYGGIYWARDAEGKEPWWQHNDDKLWWMHTEAMYALLLAYQISRQEWCLEWFERINDYAFRMFPVAVFGEWTQRLDRKGNRQVEVLAVPVKDPFHLARALINSIGVLEQLVQKG
jgi:N-acylglucosamine 2-epimerase